MTVAPVCRVGDTLNLTCTASVDFIRWSIRLVNEFGRLEEITATSNSEDESQQMTQRTVNSTTFTFMRSSAQGASPLISTLFINSLSVSLNGTVVHCTEIGGSMMSDSTTVYIIEISNSEIINMASFNVLMLLL